MQISGVLCIKFRKIVSFSGMPVQDSVGSSEQYFGTPYSVGDVSIPEFQPVLICLINFNN